MYLALCMTCSLHKTTYQYFKEVTQYDVDAYLDAPYNPVSGRDNEPSPEMLVSQSKKKVGSKNR